MSCIWVGNVLLWCKLVGYNSSGNSAPCKASQRRSRAHTSRLNDRAACIVRLAWGRVGKIQNGLMCSRTHFSFYTGMKAEWAYMRRLCAMWSAVARSSQGATTEACQRSKLSCEWAPICLSHYCITEVNCLRLSLVSSRSSLEYILTEGTDRKET